MRVRMRTLSAAAIVGTTAALALVITACRPHDPVDDVAGWSMTDPSERHPIIVTQQPSVIQLRVDSTAYGLTPSQRAQAIRFIERYRATDAGNGKLVIQAPSGTLNEVSAMHAAAELRHLMVEMGFDQTSVAVETYPGGRNQQPPVRVSHLRFFAEGPKCGDWPANLADSSSGLNYANFGCSNQRNLAAMTANPADLLVPRTQNSRRQRAARRAMAKVRQRPVDHLAEARRRAGAGPGQLEFFRR